MHSATIVFVLAAVASAAAIAIPLHGHHGFPGHHGLAHGHGHDVDAIRAANAAANAHNAAANDGHALARQIAITAQKNRAHAIQEGHDQASAIQQLNAVSQAAANVNSAVTAQRAANIAALRRANAAAQSSAQVGNINAGGARDANINQAAADGLLAQINAGAVNEAALLNAGGLGLGRGGFGLAQAGFAAGGARFFG